MKTRKHIAILFILVANSLLLSETFGRTGAEIETFSLNIPVRPGIYWVQVSNCEFNKQGTY